MNKKLLAIAIIVTSLLIAATGQSVDASLFKSDEDKVIEWGHKMTSATETMTEYLEKINQVMNECTKQITTVNAPVVAECANFFQGHLDTTKTFLADNKDRVVKIMGYWLW